MATAIGGDVLEVTWNNPGVGNGSGIFSPKSGEDSTVKLGGFITNDDATQVTGNGQNIRQMNNQRWGLQVTCSWDQNGEDEVDIINQLSAHPDETEFTVTFINGVVRGATGSPVGDIEGNGNAATFGLNIAGGGKLKKIIG